MITELKSIITLASTWVVVVKNDTEVCMYSILLSGFIEVKPALTPLRCNISKNIAMRSSYMYNAVIDTCTKC